MLAAGDLLYKKNQKGRNPNCFGLAHQATTPEKPFRGLNMQSTFHSPTALLLQFSQVARCKTEPPKLPNLYNWVSMYQAENTP